MWSAGKMWAKVSNKGQVCDQIGRWFSTGVRTASYQLVCGSQAKLLMPEDQYASPSEKDSVSGIARLVLTRPEAKNAIGKQMIQEIQQAIHAMRSMNPNEIKCLLVYSAVDGVFSAGADLKERKTMDEKQVLDFVRVLRDTFFDIQKLPVPTIAVLDGLALGGGFELSLACDLRVGGHKAMVALPETRLAIIPGAGGTQRLPRLVGLSRSKDLIFTGRRIGANEAYAIGILDRLVPESYVALDEAAKLAQQICQGGPIGMRMAKEAIERGTQTSDMASALSVEDECYSNVIPTWDRTEALQAFAEKRKPIFRGE